MGGCKNLHRCFLALSALPSAVAIPISIGDNYHTLFHYLDFAVLLLNMGFAILIPSIRLKTAVCVVLSTPPSQSSLAGVGDDNVFSRCVVDMFLRMRPGL